MEIRYTSFHSLISPASPASRERPHLIPQRTRLLLAVAALIGHILFPSPSPPRLIVDVREKERTDLGLAPVPATGRHLKLVERHGAGNFAPHSDFLNESIRC